VSNSDGWFGDAFLLGGATAAALLAEHVALWDAPHRLTPPAPYIVGTATLGVGLLGWVVRNRRADALTTFLAAGIIAVVGGGTVIVCYHVRDVARKLHQGAEQGGQLHGRIITVLRQETPDGDHRATAGHVRR
jgi:hypothetical protein